MARFYYEMTRDEVLALEQSHFERFEELERQEAALIREKDFLLYALSILDRHLAGHNRIAEIFGQCTCEWCRHGWSPLYGKGDA